MANVINRIVISDDGTAELFVKTTMNEDKIYGWIDRNYVDRIYFTGWDLTDEGFMLNFDMSLDCNRNSFKTDTQYNAYMKQAIKDLVNIDLEAA